MKTGICPICHKSFKLTKSGRMRRHGYKQFYGKSWHGFFSILISYMIRTRPPCAGSGQPAVVLADCVTPEELKGAADKYFAKVTPGNLKEDWEKIND